MRSHPIRHHVLSRMAVVALVGAIGCREETASSPDGGPLTDSGPVTDGAPVQDHDGGPASPGPRATIDEGTLRGTEQDGSHAFLGVRFAQPPVGPLRFRPPADIEPWEGEVDAVEVGHECPQFPDRADAYRGHEDCLFLNVWTPADRGGDESLPVMFFLHGGGNFSGSATEPLSYIVGVNDGQDAPIYEGARLAARGRVVVVTANYRLGPLGFLAHTTVGADGTGNWGLLDQIAALEWVKRNAHAFGGDPERVLLFGQSAGAYDVCMHMTSPASEGLFSRAAMHSGVCYAHPLSEIERWTERFVAEMGCGESADVLECLRDPARFADPQVFIESMAASPMMLASFTLHPYVDGTIVPRMPAMALQMGDFHHVPFVIGTLSDEYAHRFTTEDVTDANLAAQVMLQTGRPYAGVLDTVYPRADYDTAAAVMTDIVTDKNLTCTSRTIARLASAAQDEPVYRYHFRRRLSSPTRIGEGAYHTSDLLFLFQQVEGVRFPADDDDQAVAAHMLGYWTRFAATGDPNGAGATEWRPFDVGTAERYLAIDVETRLEENLEPEECAFWTGS